MRESKQEQIEKYVIRKNSTTIDHNYRVVDQVMIQRKTAFKYETPFRWPYGTVQTRKNGSATLRIVAVTVRVNILRIKPYNINTEKVNIFNDIKYK